MPIALLAPSCVLVDLRATGLLRGFAHDPTLTACPERVVVEGLGAGPIDSAVNAVFVVDAIEAPGGMSPADRDRLLENLRGRDVLDSARFPTIELRARYRGTLEAGTLAGELVVRGAPRALSMAVGGTRANDGVVVASGVWEGKLTSLGVKPFRALLGALKLEDWVRLRLEVRVRVSV